MIVAISGVAKAGKSTAASALINLRGFVACDLATPMKVFCRDTYGFSDAQLWGPSEMRDEIDPSWGFSPREALQKLGTEWGRALHPDTWVRACLRECAKVPLAVIADARFRNELQAVRDAGGIIVRLKRGLDASRSSHASEAEQTTIPDAFFDIVIDNRLATVAELQAMAIGVVDG